MSYLYSKKYVFVLLVCCLLLPMTTYVYAQRSTLVNNLNTFKKGFYVGAEMGVGWLQFSRDNQSESRKERFIMGFHGGYIPLRALRLGIKLDGYLIESGDFSNPEKGISISNTSFQIQVFPFKTVPLFVNGQYGWSEYINHHPYEHNASGTSQKIGLGYEYNLNKHFALSLITNYGFGRFNDVNDLLATIHDQYYDSWDITLSLTYR